MADILKMLELFEGNYDFAPAAQRDLDEIIATLRTTPPADAALADRVTPSLIIHYGQVQHENEKLREEIAALRARGAGAVPEGFVEYMKKNYPPDTVIVDAAWHAKPIWKAACHAMQVLHANNGRNDNEP